MLRRILPSFVLAGVAGFGIYWWLTATPAVSAVAALAHAPNLANGLTNFNARGCSSCHSVPGQPDRLLLGRGPSIPSPLPTFYLPNISPAPPLPIRRWTAAAFVPS